MELTGECHAVFQAQSASPPGCDNSDSAVLLRKIAQGDLSAFWKLWVQHQGHLLSVCYREMGGNRADAEDALSLAMLRALDRIPHHANAILNPKAWLTRLTSNLCKEIHRGRVRHALVAAETGSQLPGFDPAPRFSETPEESILRREILDRLTAAVQTLPIALRDPLMLRIRDELSSGEIAERLELSSDNVRKRIQVARSMLKRTLQGYLSGTGCARPGRPPSAPAAAHKLALVPGPDPDGSREFRAAAAEAIYFKSVRVTLQADIELDYCLVLDRKPAREDTRIRTLLKYSERHPNGWKKALELAYLLYTIGKWEESISLFRYVLSKRPQLTSVWLHLGNILHTAMRRHEAIDVYERALANRTRLPARHVLAGMIQSCRGDHQAAAVEFEAASKLEPFMPRLRYLWGLACQKARVFDRMLDVFSQVLQVNPDDTIALICRHDALLALGRCEDARLEIDRVLNLNPNSIPALERLVAERCGEGIVKGAEGRKTLFFIRKLIRLAPDSPNSHELMSLFYFRRGEMDKTPKPLADYTRGHPNNPFGWYLLSKWLYKLGRAAGADSALATARRLYSSCSAHAPGGPGPRAEPRGLLGLSRLQKEMAACLQDRHFVLLP